MQFVIGTVMPVTTVYGDNSYNRVEYNRIHEG